MAGNYAQLLDIINNPTNHSLPAWDNNAKQIEGETIQQYLLTIINSLTVGYQFIGVATPSTTPGTPDQNVFYIGGAGTYANFGTSITVRLDQICVFAWNGSWTNTPIEIANSGFVNVNDINGRSAAYESASAARSAVPTAYRKSGLNITYLLSTGWVIDQFFGDDVDDWTVADNWKTIGPVSVSQNSTGGYDITVGGSVANVAQQDNYPRTRNEAKNDFAICDEENNAIVIFKDGHLETKNFNSAKLILNQLGYDFAIADENSYGIVKFLDGHILTKNFDSRLFQNKITKKKVSILGDSISTYQGYMYSPDAYCAYPQTWMDNVNNTYWMRTILRFNAILGVNDSWAGTMVSNTQPTDSGQYGPNRCLSSQTRINHLGENGTPDIIVVYGGTNDIGQQVEIGTFNTENPINYTDAQIAALPVATFADAYRAMLIRLQKTYPTTKIVAIMPNYINSSLDHYISDVLDEYIEMARTICDYFGVKYLDCRTCGITLFNRNTYLGDGIHPNSDGMELISDQLVNLLKTL